MLTIEKVIILKSIEIFSKIPEKDLLWLASQITELELEADEVIIKQGDIGTSMYIIVDGKTDVLVDDKSVAILGERAFFGELATLDPEPRSATVITKEKTHLFRIDGEIIYDLLNEYPDIAKGIITVLCQRIRQKS